MIVEATPAQRRRAAQLGSYLLGTLGDFDVLNDITVTGWRRDGDCLRMPLSVWSGLLRRKDPAELAAILIAAEGGPREHSVGTPGSAALLRERALRLAADMRDGREPSDDVADLIGQVAWDLEQARAAVEALEQARAALDIAEALFHLRKVV